MSKKVVLVGHCGPDTSYLRMAVSRAAKSISVLAADDQEELIKVLTNDSPDLLLLNRELPYGFDETFGVDVIRALRPKFPNLAMMLVSNFPEAQAEAQQAGALPGFGKREIGSPRVGELIRGALGETTQVS